MTIDERIDDLKVRLLALLVSDKTKYFREAKASIEITFGMTHEGNRPVVGAVGVVQIPGYVTIRTSTVFRATFEEALTVLDDEIGYSAIHFAPQGQTALPIP